MIAADTNVVLRLILDDDQDQVRLIEQVMASQSLFLSLTVMLETGWVLASRYGMSRAQVATALSALITLERVEVARAELVQQAIDRFRAGADWADMIHLVAAHKLRRFLTLDRRLCRQAGNAAPVTIETLA